MVYERLFFELEPPLAKKLGVRGGGDHLPNEQVMIAEAQSRDDTALNVRNRFLKYWHINFQRIHRMELGSRELIHVATRKSPTEVDREQMFKGQDIQREVLAFRQKFVRQAARVNGQPNARRLETERHNPGSSHDVRVRSVLSRHEHHRTGFEQARSKSWFAWFLAPHRHSALLGHLRLEAPSRQHRLVDRVVLFGDPALGIVRQHPSPTGLAQLASALRIGEQVSQKTH